LVQEIGAIYSSTDRDSKLGIEGRDGVGLREEGKRSMTPRAKEKDRAFCDPWHERSVGNPTTSEFALSSFGMPKIEFMTFKNVSIFSFFVRTYF
jgi:hypothetical protein